MKVEVKHHEGHSALNCDPRLRQHRDKMDQLSLWGVGGVRSQRQSHRTLLFSPKRAGVSKRIASSELCELFLNASTQTRKATAQASALTMCSFRHLPAPLALDWRSLSEQQTMRKRFPHKLHSASATAGWLPSQSAAHSSCCWRLKKQTPLAPALRQVIGDREDRRVF